MIEYVLSNQTPEYIPETLTVYLSWVVLQHKDVSFMDHTDLGIECSRISEVGKDFKIIESNHKPHTAKSTTEPCSQVLYLCVQHLQRW